jgi:hypothetical protein
MSDTILCESCSDEIKRGEAINGYCYKCCDRYERQEKMERLSHHAEYEIVLETVKQVFIADMNRGGKSVTNDAERVVETLLTQAPERKTKEIVYRDSQGQWDLLVHDGVKFIGFAPYKGRWPYSYRYESQ